MMLLLALFLALVPIAAQGLAKPVIRLNSTTLSDSAVVLTAGTSFSLSCEGQADVFWKTRRNQYKKHKNTLILRPSTADDTGTYRCSYKNQSHLYSQVHIYVKDSGQPFTTPLSKAIVEREGSECLLDCLPTDPKATDLSLSLANRSVVHPEMKFTANPKEGIRIWNLRSYHSGDYVCTVNLNSRQRTSAVFQITVIERVRRPPSVVTEQEELVRVVGEQLHITCHVSNPDHSCHVMWQHSSKQKLHAENKVNSSSNPVIITSVLTLRDISISDSGNLTCIANNTAGQTRATVSLRVVDKPYAHLMPAHTSRLSVELREGDLLELAVLVDAYPAVQQRWWETPRAQNKSTYEESFHRIHKSYRCIATLLLRRIRADESGWYIFSVRSNSITSSIRFEVHVYQKPSVVVKWKNGTLVCIASANPAPTLRWFRCGNLHPKGDRCNTSPYPKVELQARQYTVEQWEKFKPQQVESILERKLLASNTTIECVAVNSVGEGHYTVQTGDLDISSTMSKQWFSRIFIAVLTGSSVVTTLLLLVLGVGIYRWKQKPRYEIRWKITEANDGNNYTYIDPSQLLYNTEWEFPRDRLRFGQVLGAGAFGKVVEATAFGLDDDERATRVAVKMLKSGAHSEEREALMSELKILSHLGPHCNIVNLLGACTHGGPVLLITEYCCNGDLLNFLRRRAQMFVNSTFQDQGLSQLYRNLPVQAAVTSYQGKQPTHRIMDASQGGEKGLDMERLLKFAGQVAHGMDFLASKKCIHRDLAARNVLVTDCFVAKICDFGLARDIMNDSNYVVRGNVRLPVKWMPPESIFQCIYTSQSDVWSYGILLWEIFSLGQTPYPDIAVDTRFYEMIKGGYHMSQPDFAPSEMYSIMKQCWSLDPGLRPPFSTVLQCITKLLPELNNSLTEPHYKNLHQELQQKLKSMQCVTAQDRADLQDRTPCCEQREVVCNQTPCHEEHEALLDKTLHCEERKDVFNQTQPHEECEVV